MHHQLRPNRRRPEFKASRRPPELTIAQILRWADEWHERMKTWPHIHSGAIPGSRGETWSAVNAALKKGCRGLPGESSLTLLLVERRGLRSPKYVPRLTHAQIIQWADEFKERTGRWPTRRSGTIAGSDGENWYNVDAALLQGGRGLPGKSTLARLLAEQRGVRNSRRLAEISEQCILRWAEAYRSRTGAWPNKESGAIPEAPGETWSSINVSLVNGTRGLPGGSTLARMLNTARGHRTRSAVPRLTLELILRWADEHHEHTGRWPNSHSGIIATTDGETWLGVWTALRLGGRGLPSGWTLPKLLSEHRGVAPYRAVRGNRKNRLTLEQILLWADEHHERTGRWPNSHSGIIASSHGETWSAVWTALLRGTRGLPSGWTLPKLLSEYRGVPHEARCKRGS